MYSLSWGPYYEQVFRRAQKTYTASLGFKTNTVACFWMFSTKRIHNGNNVALWSASGFDNQVWSLFSLPNEKPNTYKITARHSGLYLDVLGQCTHNECNIGQWHHNIQHDRCEGLSMMVSLPQESLGESTSEFVANQHAT